MKMWIYLSVMAHIMQMNTRMSLQKHSIPEVVSLQQENFVCPATRAIFSQCCEMYCWELI